MAGKVKAPETWKIIIKLLIAVSMTLFFVIIFFGILDDIKERYDYTSKDISRMLDSCSEDYYRNDYSRLKDTLTLYDLYDERFSKYWEICDAYEAYMDYKIEMNTEEDESLPLQKLKDLKENTVFSDNRKIMDSLLAEISG